MPSLKTFLVSFFTALTFSWGGSLVEANSEDSIEGLQIQGKALTEWVAQATAEDGPDDLEATVDALIVALELDNPSAKVAAADAITVLGPKAKKAIPTLLGQFGHEFPWVRVSCQAAVGSMGKAAEQRRLQNSQVVQTSIVSTMNWSHFTRPSMYSRSQYHFPRGDWLSQPRPKNWSHSSSQ